MRKLIRKTTTIISIFLIVSYALMIISTYNIVHDFKNCIKDDVENLDVKSSELYKYYCRNALYDNRIYDVQSNVIPLLVIHGFNKGTMFVKYNCKTFDKEGTHIYGASNVYAKWHIEKKNGRWVVVEIFEKP